MRTIRIDDDVWRALQEQAKPLEDTPNSVLRRVFHLKERKVGSFGRVDGRAARGEKTHNAAYRQPILRAMFEMGGSGRTAVILDRVGELMKDRLTPVDFGRLSGIGGGIRWRTTAMFERKAMVNDGLLKDKEESGRGIWELTSKGTAAAEHLVGSDRAKATD